MELGGLTVAVLSDSAFADGLNGHAWNDSHWGVLSKCWAAWIFWTLILSLYKERLQKDDGGTVWPSPK
jgi:hypothetical protein